MSDRSEDLPKKIWSWRAKDQAGLPPHFKGLFDTTDECKPLDNGRQVLITSSRGAVALVDRDRGQVLFYARAANAHSADLLPENRVAVAASGDREGKGDRLIIFDLDKPDQQLCSDALPSGHGVVWDGKRQVLWALSGKDIRAYKLQNWGSSTPRLARISAIALPEGGGHDLYPITGSAFLSVTTSGHCWHFDRDTQEFTPHPMLADEPRVKSICQHPVTGQLVYVQAEGGHWWAESIHLLQPEGVLHVPGEHFYKARWNIKAS